MHQRDLVRKAWVDVGLYDTKDAKLRQFLKLVDEAPIECWTTLADLIHIDYPEYLEKLIMPIWNTGDKLLRLNLIRAADLKRPDEKRLAQKLVRKLDPEADALELRAVIQTGPIEVLDVVAHLRALPDHMRVLVDMRRARLAP